MIASLFSAIGWIYLSLIAGGGFVILVVLSIYICWPIEDKSEATELEESLAEAAIGTCASARDLAIDFDLDENLVLQILEEHELAKCWRCEYWTAMDDCKLSPFSRRPMCIPCSRLP